MPTATPRSTALPRTTRTLHLALDLGNTGWTFAFGSTVRQTSPPLDGA
jgi:hypothetical protein